MNTVFFSHWTKRFKNLLLILGILSLGIAQNQYPIILVHGFLGWGPEELGSYQYWGGTNDIAAELEAMGYTVYTASVGPVSSNWERSVELFTQIKGGQLDYGKKHADTWGIIQKPEGKFYPGLYPEWDENHPVHLIGHSMGGQTIRMLATQLNSLYYVDDSDTTLERSPLLGQINNGWIASISTFATPHNGTTLSDIVTRTIPFLQYFIGLAAVMGTQFYDFDLEHWDFSRNEDELWMNYFKRMREHKAWNSKNISSWDLGIEGAKQLNTQLPIDPNIYYFSYAFSATRPDSNTGHHIPNDDMSLILRARARIIGKATAYWEDGTQTDSTWFENDGVVNTISQIGPQTGLNGPDPIGEFSEGQPLIPGQWYNMGVRKMDHWTVVGHGSFSDEEWVNLMNMYSSHCKLLYSLP